MKYIYSSVSFLEKLFFKESYPRTFPRFITQVMASCFPHERENRLALAGDKKEEQVKVRVKKKKRDIRTS